MKDSASSPQDRWQADQHEQTLVLGQMSTTQLAAMPHAFLPAGTRLHEFEISGLIGEGGFGVVYLAFDHQLQRHVALKEYLPATLALRGQGHEVTLRSERHAETFAKGLQSFINEARLLARFDHPALVKVHRFWEANGTAYLVMPYYEGPTLKAARQAMAQAPDEVWIRQLLAPLLDALELVHGQGCLHRDIAPDNILLVDGRPVLLDFGAARRVIGDMTQALTVILKPGYAPIEQYAEMAGVRQGPWTDLYALGAVVHFLLTGQAPPPSVGRMMHDSCGALALSATGLYSAALLTAIDRCLAVRAEDRPQSVAQLRGLLGHVASASAASTAQRMREQALARSVTRHMAWSALAAAGLLGGWLLYASQSGTRAPDSVPAVTETGTSLPASLAAAPARHDIESAWNAITQDSSPDYGLAISGLRNPLRTDHDSLELELRSARDGWVYLLLWDKANDHVGLLLPNQVDQDNRIKAGKPLRLPRPGWRYVADAPAGTWEVLLLVSDSPRSFPALALAPDGVMLAASRKEIEQALESSGTTVLSGTVQCHPGASCPNDHGVLRLTLQEIDAR